MSTYIGECKLAQPVAESLVRAHASHTDAAFDRVTTITRIMSEASVGSGAATDEWQRALNRVFGPGEFAHEAWDPFSPNNPGWQSLQRANFGGGD